MTRDIISDAKKLLAEPQKLEPIPIQRATAALGIDALNLGPNHSFHYADYLIYPNNLYLSFDGNAARDENNNFDSPIFQNDRYDGQHKPLWQLFREKFEERIHTTLSAVYFGEYTTDGKHDDFFIVKSEPKGCRWRITKKASKGTIFITAVSEKEATECQAILDEIRLARAIETVRQAYARTDSRANREEAIVALNSKYHDDFERFTFGEETFRFRQFNTEFFYTDTGLAAFDDFYQKVCIPYRNDEFDEEIWRDQSRQLTESLINDPEFYAPLHFYNVSGFKTTRLQYGGCRIESDLIDDRTGKPFQVVVHNQKPNEVRTAVATQLRLALQRKEQVRRAGIVLQRLASSNN